MIPSNSFLFHHLTYLLANDRDFLSFWKPLTKYERWMYIDDMIEIDELRASRTVPDSELSEYDTIARTLFTSVEQIPIEFTSFDHNMGSFLRSTVQKYHAMVDTHRYLKSVLSSHADTGSVYWYGHIKSPQSLARKLQRLGIKHPDSSAERQILDAVRFRVVVTNASELIPVTKILISAFGSRVLGCRNYISWPRIIDAIDPYKVIHLIVARSELEIKPIEIQLMSRRREIVSMLDHSVLFRKAYNSLSADHHRWLHDFSMVGSFADFTSSVVIKGTTT